MEIDIDDLDGNERYRTISTLVAPRPIAWVSTRSADGIDNLAPFSFFNIISSRNPPVLMFSPGVKPGGAAWKDTAANVAETGECVINFVTPDMAAKMDETSHSVDAEVSEFDFANVERAESVKVDPPRVGNTSASIECKEYDILEIGNNTAVLAEVVYIHLDDDLVADHEDLPDPLAYCSNLVGRIGGPYFTAIEPLDLESVSISKLWVDN